VCLRPGRTANLARSSTDHQHFRRPPPVWRAEGPQALHSGAVPARPDPSPAAPVPRQRAAADHRPQVDPDCAGCPQLALLRTLRRAGVPAAGRLSCEPGRWPFLAETELGRSRLLVSAGPDEPDPGTAALAGPGAVERLDPGDPAALEAAVARALARPGTTWLVAVARCVIGLPRAAPLRVVEARCNRCGACLSLACPAIRDEGGEAMSIDGAVCTGCSRCAPLCRGSALAATGSQRPPQG